MFALKIGYGSVCAEVVFFPVLRMFSFGDRTTVSCACKATLSVDLAYLSSGSFGKLASLRKSFGADVCHAQASECDTDGSIPKRSHPTHVQLPKMPKTMYALWMYVCA